MNPSVGGSSSSSVAVSSVLNRENSLKKALIVKRNSQLVKGSESIIVSCANNNHG